MPGTGQIVSDLFVTIGESGTPTAIVRLHLIPVAVGSLIDRPINPACTFGIRKVWSTMSLRISWLSGSASDQCVGVGDYDLRGHAALLSFLAD